jgi:hypothetical protein
MKTAPNYQRDDIVTIAEARESMKPHSPTRDALHKAINRGKLKKLPDQPDGLVRMRWGDVLDYVALGGFKKRGPKGPCPQAVVATSKLDEDVFPAHALSLTCIVPPRANTISNKAPAEAISVEVLPKETEYRTACTQELEEVEKLVIELPSINDEDLIKRIKNYSDRAEVRADEAVAAGSRAAICAWACGTILNRAKLKCGHGKFITWMEEHISSSGISLRTYQRYMKLARNHTCVRALIESKAGLKDAYVACGILQEPVKPRDEADDCGGGDADQGGNPPSLVKALMSCATALQKGLLKFTTSGEVLSTPDLDKLSEVIKELTSLHEQLLHKATDKDQTAA